MRAFQLSREGSERPRWREYDFRNERGDTTDLPGRSHIWSALEEKGVTTCRSLSLFVDRDCLQLDHPDRIALALEQLHDPIDELFAGDFGSTVDVFGDYTDFPIPPFRMGRIGIGDGAIIGLGHWLIDAEIALSQGSIGGSARRFFITQNLPHQLIAGQCTLALTASVNDGAEPQLLDGAIVAANDGDRRDYTVLGDWLIGEPAGRAALSEALFKIGSRIQASFAAEFLWTGDDLILFDLCANEFSKRANALSVRQQLLEGKAPARSILMAARVRDILDSDADLHSDAFRDCLEIARIPSFGTRVAAGRIAISREQVDTLSGQKQPVVLLCERLDPAEASVLPKLAGLVIRIAGPASHITVMAHAAGVAVLSGAQQLQLDVPRDAVVIGGEELQAGDWVTVDEVGGRLFKGAAQLTRNTEHQCRIFVERGASFSQCRFLVNANSPTEAAAGIEHGAQGIGLCRSEAHVFHRQLAKALWGYVAAWLDSGRAPEIPLALVDEMGAALRDLLRSADGRVVNYRLIDASVHELRDGASELPTRLSSAVQNAGFGLRGPRWALPSGFYAEQVRLTVSTAKAVADLGQDVDLILTVPSVATVAELLAVKRLLQEAMSSAPSREHCKIRLGVMLETTRAVILAGEMARLADVLCFGLNDLTQSVWSLGRESWQLLQDSYRSQGLVTGNPFASLDSAGLLGLLGSAIQSARSVRSDIEIIVCGEQTSDEFTARALGRFAPIALSCHADDLSAAALGVIKAGGGGKSIPLPDNAMEVCTHVALERLGYARQSGRLDVGHKIALDWAQQVSARAGIAPSENWKIFKRDLVQRLFGKLDIRRFQPPWSADDAAAYALAVKNSGATARYSVFPGGISCHSKSETIRPNATLSEVRSKFSALDPSASVEVFPQQSPDQLCFRAVYSRGLTTIEAGWGQAMYVFENERGNHAICLARYDLKTRTWALHCPVDADDQLVEGLKALTVRHGQRIRASFYFVAHTLGMDAFAIEGYFDARSTNFPVIVDIDLPTDFAWN